MIISGSEDGNVYIWDREPVAGPVSQESAVPPVTSAPISPSLFGAANVSRASSLRVPATQGLSTSPSGNRASPAYYPPKQRKLVQTSLGAGAGVNVRPTKVLEGHGDGAVFDVRWRDGEIISAGEDGVVGVWYASDEVGE